MRLQPSRLAVSLGLSLGIVLNSAAATHFVDLSCTNPVPPYSTWATAATNIQDAVTTASFLDTVLVTNGVYQYAGVSAPGPNRVLIMAPILLESVNGPAVTVIKGYQAPGTTNGPSAVRCVFLGNGGTLSGFTLTGGATSTTGYGGGIDCQSTNCLVTNCVITGNAASYAGGVFSGTLSRCIINGNTATYTGGGAQQSTLLDCVLSNNAALGLGWGGGADDCLLANCLLAGNQAGYRGGAAEGSTLINCTVVGNSGMPDSLDLCKLENCIAYYNAPDNGEESGDQSSFTNCCVAAMPVFNSANNITNSPQFLNAAGGDYHLSAASPCLNAGNNSFVINGTDLDGKPRIIAGIVDLGAYEFQSPVHCVDLNSSNPVSPYTGWTTAASNIQDAVDASANGDLILVTNGVYQTGGRVVYGNSTNRVVVNKSVTVQSLNGPAATVIQGYSFRASSIRCVYLTNGASLFGFTLTNGGAIDSGDILREQSGGGVWCEDLSAVVSNCVITRGFAYQSGGGAYQGTLLNCVLANNDADQNGGGAFQGLLYNCVLTNNNAYRGGGACSNLLIGCTLAKNLAQFQNLDSGGGAFYCTLSNCLITGNNSWGGGGGAAFSALTSCVVSNNTGNSAGGGVCLGIANNSLISSNQTFNSGGGAYSNVLNNCILQNNVATSSGGGAYGCALENCTVVSNSAGSVGGGTFWGSASNSIIYYNSSPKNPNYQVNTTVIPDSCCTTPSPGGAGNITNEPAFVNLAAEDFHLQSNSPCINSGNNASVTGTTDLDGNARIVAGRVDIGAYEYPTPTSVISYAWLQQYGLPADGSVDYLDLDGTGMNVYQDWVAGLNPTNASSVLKLLTPGVSGSAVNVSWQSVSNRSYWLERSSNLAAQPSFSIVQSNIVGQDGTTSFQDLTATNGGPYFYRVGVQ